MSTEQKDANRTENKRENLAGDERWNLVLRVSESKGFSRAPKLRNFLKYVCESALTNQTQDLHEQRIGCAVFDRREGYNPAEDNIVRVEARELRKRLDRYFARQGKAERVRISIPKGSYVPIFERNSGNLHPADPPEASGESLDLPVQDAIVPIKEGRRPRRSMRMWRIAAAFILFIATLFGGYWAGGGLASRHRSASIRTGAAGVWPLLFPVKSTINIVSADASLVLVQYLSHKTVSLSYYLSGKYSENSGNPTLQRIAPNPYIDFADLQVTTKILGAIQPLGWKVDVRYPRYIDLSDLDTKNLVFLGSAYSDPWINKFHPYMNFVVQMDWTTGNLCFENKKPMAGEQAKYCAEGGPGQEDVTYGLVTLLPNLQGTGNVLILEGTTGAGSEAAGDFITDPHYAAAVLKYLRLDSKDTSVPYFQILIKTVVLNNNPGTLKILAHRIITGRS